MEVDGCAEPQATCDIRLIGPRGCVAIEREIVPVPVFLGTVVFFVIFFPSIHKMYEISLKKRKCSNLGEADKRSENKQCLL